MKVIAPRLPTPMPSGTGRTTQHLPADMMSAQVRRLQLLGSVGAALWTFGLFMDAVTVPLAAGVMHLAQHVAIDAGAVVVSVAMAAYMRYSKSPPATKANVGLLYMLFSAFAVANNNTWPPAATVEALRHISWVCVVILVFAMISASSPRTMLVASLAAASMDPLAAWFAHLRGIPVPPPLQTLALALPNYACAFVAVLPARAQQLFTRRLREAQQLGSYELVELLGHGGMGEVWRARHRLLARHAAIKLVRPDVLGARTADDAKVMMRRFEREAQATAALSSPHTIDLFDYGVTDDGTFYYVMELLIGRDLESLVREFGPLPADRVMFLLRQVCHSLADAHARSLVHRDIKPANIYACRMGLEYDFVKVLDFGLVKFSERDTGERTKMTADHTTTGTPAYMAPEIILGDVVVDRRADVYALGCVAYYLLTGQLVFEAENSMKMLLQHVNADPVPPSARTELPIPPELDALVLACLQKDPDRRPQDAGELFRMACRCETCNCWTYDEARQWWEQHLPELTGPLTLAPNPPLASETPTVVGVGGMLSELARNPPAPLRK
jgi:serine/threonine-protein kinase